jgi:ribose 5-phosphate isomerase RpiB
MEEDEVFFICRTGATGNLLLINGFEGIIARLAADGTMATLQILRDKRYA